MKDMLACPNPPVPVLEGIVGVPVFAPDGTLHDTPGYSPTSRMIYARPVGLEIPPMPMGSVESHITSARELIVDGWLCDFPFVSAAERAHAVAMSLLLFGRNLINGPT